MTVSGGVAENAGYNTAQVSRNCEGNERAISAGTGWSDQDTGLELWTAEMRPLLNSSNQVVGFTARGGNDSGNTSTFTIYVLCYTP